MTLKDTDPTRLPEQRRADKNVEGIDEDEIIVRARETQEVRPIINPHLDLVSARMQLSQITDDFLMETAGYLRENNVAIVPEAAHAVGAFTIAPIVDAENGFFDFPLDVEAPGTIRGCVVEALAKDAETVLDLVAWPLECPEQAMTMFGRCALLGVYNAMNPATYFLDYPLIVHRTPLDFMRAGFRGACVVAPRSAARILCDLPGSIAACDEEHGRELQALIDRFRPQVLVPAKSRTA